MRRLLLLLCMALLAVPVYPRKKIHDKDKENIIRSTEVGQWKFSPDWYMWAFHNGYSGAYTKWEWHGLKSGLYVHFKETKSNVKTVMPRRAESLAGQEDRKKEVENQRVKIKELAAEETARSLDRNVDLVYSKYKGYFADLKNNINSNLAYSMSVSKGKLADAVAELRTAQEIIESNISYLRKTGLGYELENQKRDQGFRDSMKDLEALLKQSKALAIYTHAYFTD